MTFAFVPDSSPALLPLCSSALLGHSITFVGPHVVSEHKSAAGRTSLVLLRGQRRIRTRRTLPRRSVMRCRVTQSPFDCPMAAVTASGCVVAPESEQPGICARFSTTDTLGPASLSIRYARLPAVSSGRAQHGKSKAWSYNGLSVDCLLTQGHSPQIVDALMRPNDQDQTPRAND
jgi:hypothetical protein